MSDVNLSECGKAGGRHNRGGRGHDGLTGATVKVRQGSYKGYRGRVIEVKGSFVRVELESQMKVVTGKFCNLSKYLSCMFLCIYMFSDLVVCS